MTSTVRTNTAARRYRLVAARPNLNKPGCLTIHPVSARGRPDYSRVLWHTQPGESILLSGVTTHVRSSAALIHAGERHKFPCAALVGRLLTGTGTDADADGIPEPMTSVSYNPRIRPDAFIIRQGPSADSPLRGAAYALLQGRQAWVHDPHVAEN